MRANTYYQSLILHNNAGPLRTAASLEGPGLGIEFDEELAATKPFVPSLQGPRLRGLAEWAGWVGAGFLDRKDAGTKLA